MLAILDNKFIFLHYPRSAGISICLSLRPFYTINTILLLGTFRHAIYYDLKNTFGIDYNDYSHKYISIRNPVNSFISTLNLLYYDYLEIKKTLCLKNYYLTIVFNIFSEFEETRNSFNLVDKVVYYFYNDGKLLQNMLCDYKTSFIPIRFDNLKEDFEKMCIKVFGNTVDLIKINNGRNDVFEESFCIVPDLKHYIAEKLKTDIELYEYLQNNSS